MRNMIFRSYVALMALITSSLACLAFAFRLGNWARTDFNFSLAGLTASFIISILAYKVHRQYSLLFCVLCGNDLSEGNGLKNGQPCIPVKNTAGRILGAACAACCERSRAR